MFYTKRILPLFFLLLSACSDHHVHVLGYIEGKYIYLSSPIPGHLIQLAVQKGDTVKVGQLAWKLDPQPEASDLAKAKEQLQAAQQDLENLKSGERSTIIKRLEAQILQAQANVAYSEKMHERNAALAKTGAIGLAVVDQWEAQHEADIQKLQAAKANLAEAKLGARSNLISAQEAKMRAAQNEVTHYQWTLDQKTKYFSQAGYVQDTLYRQNEYVAAGKPVIQFLPPENREVVFFIPQKQLSFIHAGQSITFTCDECQKPFSATIDFISTQAEYTPPVIYSRDSRDKLVYRVEAKMDLNTAINMKPGLPVEVTI
jgi:HlyD family secretion protein